MDDRSGIEIVRDIIPSEFTEDAKWWSDLERARNLLWRDQPREPVDILYFFGRSYFDAPKRGLYRLAVDLYQQGMVKKIIIPGTEGERFGGNIPREAHPGKTLMRNRLVVMGVINNDVIFSEGGRHTRAEGDAFLKFSKEHDFLRAIALTNPHQIVRAMLGLVKKINDDHLPMLVYAVVPNQDNFDWGRLVKGSQGLERKPVSAHLYDENKKISDYQRRVPPDLASFEELFEYFRIRDAGRTTR